MPRAGKSDCARPPKAAWALLEKFRGVVVGAARRIPNAWSRLIATRANAARLNRVSESGRERERLPDDRTILSHELRAPLAAILLAAEALEHGISDPAPLARIIRPCAEQMLGLVDGMLQVDAFEAGAISELRRVRIAATLSELSPIATTLADAKGVEYHTPDESSVTAMADPLLLRHALLNLITNAIRYTEPGGRVAAHIFKRRGVAGVTIRDTGIGIEPAEIPRVLRPFERGSNAPESGYGLGLSIALKLVEAQGGTLKIGCSPSGSDFSIELRAAPVRSA